MTPDDDLVRGFDAEMEGIHDAAKAIGYNAMRYLLILKAGYSDLFSDDERRRATERLSS